MSTVTHDTFRIPNTDRNQNRVRGEYVGARISTTPARASRTATCTETPSREGRVGTTPRVPTLPRAEALRHCRRCETDQPAWSFVLADDPATKETHRGIRLWCGFCLLNRGHIRRSQLDAAHEAHLAAEEARAEADAAARAAKIAADHARAARATARAELDVDRVAQRAVGPVVDRKPLHGVRFNRIQLTDKQREQVVAKIAEHGAVNALFDAALTDEGFARALRRACAALDRTEGAA